MIIMPSTLVLVPVCMAGKEHARVRMTSLIRFFYFMGMPQRVRVR
ncbi:hypothetical protein CEV33_1635 [Brucella grignonensis]|uniref:Uncharacterized protein n=1 Tax=Brucella grignonensis TaxID=94627 RepID=A0A256FCC1_9HYPH|nr:hypothetical protein CEV33_1635 [Brucella grignonensis]